MTLYELLGEWILEWPIVEQASERNIVKSKITDTGRQILIHLIKIYSWDNPRDYDNHLKDINGWLGLVYGLKIKGNKYPKPQDYYTWLMEYADDSSFVTRQIENIDYTVPRSGRSDEEVYAILKYIIQHISYDMGNRKFTRIRDYMI